MKEHSIEAGKVERMVRIVFNGEAEGTRGRTDVRLEVLETGRGGRQGSGIFRI